MPKNIQMRRLWIIALIVSLTIVSCGKINTEEGDMDSTALPPTETMIESTDTQMPEEEVKDIFYCLPGIIPGVTTRNEIIQKMGEPESSEIAENGSEYLFYSSAVEEIPDTIIIRQDVVERLSALNRDGSLDLNSLQGRFGEPEEVTYSYFSMEALTYLYPKNGFSLIAEPEGGQVYWMECYVPMSLNDYMSGPGSSLPLSNPYIR